MAYTSDGDRATRELENIQYKSNRLTDESLESTRRMVAMTQETQEVGVKTLEALDEQGEQLDRAENGLDTINADMKQAEKHMNQMEKCCGLCLCPCGRSRSIEKDPRYGKTWSGSAYDKEDELVARQGVAGASARGQAQPGGGGGGYVHRVTNDAREDEMDENLGQVSNAVSNLKNMALDMGTELERQNVQLDRINDKAELNDTRIKEASSRADNIYRKS